MTEQICDKEILKNRQIHKKLIDELRGRKTINVIFIVSSLAMWQHQQIYELMAENKYFRPTIIFVPFKVYSEEENLSTLKQLKKYFGERNTPFFIYSEMDFSKYSFREQFKPDVLFYPQWYSGLYDANIDISSFFDRLICLIPYGICITQNMFCNYDANNYAWKQYQTSPIHLRIAQEVSRCRGDNMVIVGYPKADIYCQDVVFDPWKPQNKNKKRVIWAPHFTINAGITPLYFSHFLELHEVMWNLAMSYKDTVQFAFKPHPRLLTELYKLPEWGKERTDEYYRRWADGENTQLETGTYEELFKTSDAMIHDCGSFAAEYHYVQKPVMYISADVEKLKKDQNFSSLGCAAIDVCYLGSTEKDFRSFIENVVIAGQDPMRTNREHFLQNELCQPKDITSSALIYKDICRELWVDNEYSPLSFKQKFIKLCHQLFP